MIYGFVFAPSFWWHFVPNGTPNSAEAEEVLGAPPYLSIKFDWYRNCCDPDVGWRGDSAPLMCMFIPGPKGQTPDRAFIFPGDSSGLNLKDWHSKIDEKRSAQLVNRLIFVADERNKFMRRIFFGPSHVNSVHSSESTTKNTDVFALSLDSIFSKDFTPDLEVRVFLIS